MCLKVDKNLKLNFQASEENIRLEAYCLWEKAGKPLSDGKEFWEQAKQICNHIVAYKVVLMPPNKIISPLNSSALKEGWNYSSRQNKEFSVIELVDGIDQGFHVYLTKEDAIMAKDSWLGKDYPYDSKIINVLCFESDFVAAGYDRGFKSAVFTKIMVEKL